MSLNYPTQQSDQEFFDEQVQKVVDSLTRQAAEKDLVKTLTTDLKESYGSEPASVRKLAKYLYDQSVEGLLEEVEEMVEVFNSINKMEEK